MMASCVLLAVFHLFVVLPQVLDIFGLDLLEWIGYSRSSQDKSRYIEPIIHSLHTHTGGGELHV